MKYFQPTKRLRQYLILESISSSQNGPITQRQIADKAEISPAVVNKYLTEFNQTNLTAKEAINQRDYSYSLTSQGEGKKREMMVEYIRETFQLFSAGKAELAQILTSYQTEYNVENLLFYTAGEVTELLLHSLEETNMNLLAIVDDDQARQGTELFGYPIISEEEITRYDPDAVIITTFRYRNKIYEKIKHLREAEIEIIKF